MSFLSGRFSTSWVSFGCTRFVLMNMIAQGWVPLATMVAQSRFSVTLGESSKLAQLRYIALISKLGYYSTDGNNVIVNSDRSMLTHWHMIESRCLLRNTSGVECRLKSMSPEPKGLAVYRGPVTCIFQMGCSSQAISRSESSCTMGTCMW